MRTFRLNKLVRDKIIKSTEAQGGEVQFRRLSKGEKIEALIDKIIEEAMELAASESAVSEIADIREALLQLAREHGITEEDILLEQERKLVKNGGFEKGHFIKTLTLPADNEWAKYYASDPKRFPEIIKIEE